MDSVCVCVNEIISFTIRERESERDRQAERELVIIFSIQGERETEKERDRERERQRESKFVWRIQASSLSPTLSLSLAPVAGTHHILPNREREREGDAFIVVRLFPPPPAQFSRARGGHP